MNQSSGYCLQSDNDNQIIAMDHFLIGYGAQDLADLFSPQADNATGIGGGVVAQAAGEFAAVGIAEGHDVAFTETADYFNDADSEQTASLLFHGRACPGIDDDAAFRSSG